MRTNGRFRVRICGSHGRDVCNKGAHCRLCAEVSGFLFSGLWLVVSRRLEGPS